MAKKRGMFWHCHHDKLVEYCYDYDERVKFIKENKSKNEIETQLRLFKPVKGKLPSKVDKAVAAYAKARTACAKAVAAYAKVRTAYDKTVAAYDKARTAYDKTRAAYYKTWAAYYETWAAYDKVVQDNMPAILKLHEKECPDCGWNGKTIKF